MKKISLKRPKEKFNKYCAYQIYLGDAWLTELKNGEDKVLEIPPELQNEPLKARIQWCGSRKFNISSIDDHGVLKITGNEFLNWKMPLIGSMIPLLGLTLFSGADEPLKSLGTGVLLLFIAGLIGTLTLWRNTWLKIQGEKE